MQKANKTSDNFFEKKAGKGTGRRSPRYRNVERQVCESKKLYFYTQVLPCRPKIGNPK
jgi:hypothetical protein